MMGSPIDSMCPNCNRSTRDPVLMRPVACACDFRAEVLRTSPETGSGRQRLIMGALGLAGEGGEVIDLIKKYEFQGKALDRSEMIKELGDVRWYLECIMIAVDTTMDEIERVNISKLRKRYPNGFTVADAVARKDELKFPPGAMTMDEARGRND